MSVSCFSFILGDSAGHRKGNHPCEKIPSNPDAFGRRKSSLRGIFIKSGWTRAEKIISGRNFHQIRMHLAGENHPCEKIPSNQDAFGRRKSSLRGNFIKSGWIRAEEIISGRKFHQIRMNSAGENHLWEEFPSNQDASRWKKSSLDEYSAKSGCIWLSQLFRIFIHWIPAAWSCWNPKRMQSEHGWPGTVGARVAWNSGNTLTF